MPSFENADGSFFAEASGGPVRVVTPATGDTIAMRASVRALYCAHAATIATLTILLPPVDPGEKVEIIFKNIVTALTMQDSRGAAITGAPTTAAAAGTLIVMRFVDKTIGWVPWK